jgi:RIO kinase 2
MIDFPQMVSTSHRDSKMYFDRDVQCVRTYFLRKFKFVSEEYPEFFTDTTKTIDLDVQLAASGAASGFTPEELEQYQRVCIGACAVAAPSCV